MSHLKGPGRLVYMVWLRGSQKDAHATRVVHDSEPDSL